MSNWVKQIEAVRKRLLARNTTNKNKNNAKRKAAENWWFGDKTYFNEKNKNDLNYLNLNWNPNNGFINIRAQKKEKAEQRKKEDEILKCAVEKQGANLGNACVIQRKRTRKTR